MREQEISLWQYEGDIDEENLGNRGEKVKFFRDEGNINASKVIVVTGQVLTLT